MTPVPGNEQAELKRFIGRLRRAYRAGATWLALARLGWMALAAMAVLTVLDVVWPLPAGTRVALALAAPLAVLAIALGTWLHARRARSLDRHVVRCVEAGYAPLQNDLINAVEFSERLEPGQDPTTADLMRQTIDRAVSEVKPVRDWAPLVTPAHLRREWRLLGMAALLTTVAALLFGEVWGAVLPRYLDPHGDHPPYSPTHLKVMPEGARIDYGDRLLVKVATSGVPAEEAFLNIENPFGASLNRLPMFQGEEGEFYQAIEDVKQPLRYYISVPGGRSRRYDLSLNQTPRVESVTLILRPPAYTHLPEQLRILTGDVIKCQAGGRARLTFASNRPLRGGRLLSGGRAVPLQRTGQQEVSGELALEEAGDLTAELEDIDGNRAEAAWNGRVEILPDGKPAVSIVSPGMDSFAIPTVKVPIVIEANDDLGFTHVKLIRNINGSMDFTKTMYTGDGGESFVHAVETLDLADLGVRPGDIISYYAMATDSLPDAPQTAATPAYQLAIISADEYRRYTQQMMTAEDLQAKYQEFQDQLEELARRQAELEKQTEELRQKAAGGHALDQTEKEELADAGQRQGELAGQTQALAERMREEAARPEIFDIEKAYKEELARFAGQLDQAAGAMGEAQPPMGQASAAAEPASAAGALGEAGQSQRQALDALKKTGDEYEKGIGETSRELAGATRLMGDVDRFKELYQRQASLERQTRLFQEMNEPGLDDRVRMKELAEEEADIRQQLEQLASELNDHAAQVEADLPKVAGDARKIAGEIASRKIPGLMQQAQDRLAEADGPKGQPPAAEALAEMKAMISFCNATGQASQGELRLRISISKGMSLGQTLEQMAAGGLGSAAGQLGVNGRGGRSRGGGGSYGSASQFGMFGSEKFGRPTSESRVTGSPNQSQSLPGEVSPVSAFSVEENISDSPPADAVGIGPGERVMEEYRPLIEAYFQGLAEENK